MLNNDQIVELAEIGKLRLKFCDGIPISVSRIADIPIEYSYKLFKEKLGLNDLRLDWLLGKHNCIAGGSVLNWIWGENKHADIDFFFQSDEYAEVFVEFIKNIGFKLTNESGYASTYFEPNQGIILQVIGFSSKHGSKDFVAFGDPSLLIDNFDLHVCKFAVSSDNVHTTSRAIQDLLKLTIDTTGHEKHYVKDRILKYIRKGFFVSPRIKGALSYAKSDKELPIKRRVHGIGW